MSMPTNGVAKKRTSCNFSPQVSFLEKWGKTGKTVKQWTKGNRQEKKKETKRESKLARAELS